MYACVEMLRLMELGTHRKCKTITVYRSPIPLPVSRAAASHLEHEMIAFVGIVIAACTTIRKKIVRNGTSGPKQCHRPAHLDWMHNRPNSLPAHNPHEFICKARSCSMRTNSYADRYRLRLATEKFTIVKHRLRMRPA